MRGFIGAAVLSALLSLLVMSPATAQDYRGGIGVYGSGAWFSGLATGSTADLDLKEGWLAGIEVESWSASGRIGLRLNGSYTERDVLPRRTDINVYTADIGLMVRMLEPSPDRAFAPYVVVGAGAAHYNPADDTPFESGITVLADDPSVEPAGVVGVGGDVWPRRGIGLRLEVADHVLPRSPFEGNGERFGSVHNLRATIGVHARFGHLSTPRFADAAAPPPPERTATSEDRDAIVDELTSLEQRIDALATAVERQTRSVDALATSVGRLPDTRQIIAAAAEGLEPRQRSAAASPVESDAANASSASASSAAAAADDAPSLYTVQIASYEAERAGQAWQLAEQMYRERLPAWVSRAEVEGRTYHRVRVGALPSRAEAGRLARELRATAGAGVWVTPVEQHQAVPSNAVVATRAFLRDR